MEKNFDFLKLKTTSFLKKIAKLLYLKQIFQLYLLMIQMIRY